MSPEHPLADSGAERRTKSNRPRSAKEAPAAVPTPNRFWRIMTDPGFPSPASNPAPPAVTAEAFLGLTSQVQALAGMVQTIISYLPQLMHSAGTSTSASASGITNSPKSRNHASRRGATGQGHRGSHTSGPDFTDVDTYPIANPNS
ncbi:hypothetical protein B296_00031935 [Ensete ventricosum]|uniref:Uncharacterized protein n=1 Tax=Ensete ventricosum TaxID=4639 RepID=A0A426ZHY6_ENSVE|nr:hypothetical protein B296_00031935 [Ensete ventricosum]